MRTLRSRLIQFGEDLIEGRKGGGFLLYPLSLLWGFIALCKNVLFDRGLLSVCRVSKPVLSIGNLVAGGTGKTPLTLLFAQTFRNKRTAILSRGSGMQGALADEPALLARRVPETKIYLGKDRRVSAKKAIDDGCELLILDDGFQHRKMGRDFDLVLLSTVDPFGKGSYLPRGYLRDSPKRLCQADAIFLNPIETEIQLEAWRDRLAASGPLIGVRLEVSRIVGGDIAGAPVGLFSGIAKPLRFKKTVVDRGANVVHELILADHEGISKRDLQTFALVSKSLGAKCLVCTEKDFVKLPQNLNLCLPLIYLEMSMKITAGEENWQNLVAKIERKIDNCGTYDR